MAWSARKICMFVSDPKNVTMQHEGYMVLRMQSKEAPWNAWSITVDFVFPKKSVFQKKHKSICSINTIWECFEYLIYVGISRIQALLGKQTQQYLIKYLKVLSLTAPILPYSIFENLYRGDYFSQRSNTVRSKLSSYNFF